MQNSSAGAYPSPLYLSRCQHDDSSILLPDHSPEVIHCFRQAALCGNVSPLRPGHLTTNVVSIDVVRAHNSGVCIFEDNTCVVNWEQRRGSVWCALQLQDIVYSTVHAHGGLSMDFELTWLVVSSIYGSEEIELPTHCMIDKAGPDRATL